MKVVQIEVRKNKQFSGGLRPRCAQYYNMGFENSRSQTRNVVPVLIKLKSYSVSTVCLKLFLPG